jgi:hypothetical protein
METMTNQPAVHGAEAAPHRLIEVEYLYLDLDTCSRCRATDHNLRAAIEVLEPVFAAARTAVRLRSMLVNSEEQARELGFASSPTIRIDGADIAGELVESECADCGELCGCGAGVDCRVWRYRGADYEQAPTGLIVEALAAAVGGFRPPPAAALSFEVPENLKRVFAARAAGSDGDVPESACCSAGEAASCRDASGKVSCCGGGSGCDCR